MGNIAPTRMVIDQNKITLAKAMPIMALIRMLVVNKGNPYVENNSAAKSLAGDSLTVF